MAPNINYKYNIHKVNNYSNSIPTNIHIYTILLKLQDGLLDEAVFENAQTTQQSMEETVHKLESTVDMLNNRLQGLLTDVGEEQAKIKQRICKIELR